MKQIILIVLVVVAVLTAPVGWYVATRLTDTGGETGERIAALEAEVEELRQLNRNLTIDLNALTQRVLILEESGVSSGGNQTFTESDAVDSDDSLADSFAQVVLIGNRRDVNAGLTNSSSRFLTGLWGMPAEGLNNEVCHAQGITNPFLKDLVKTENVGPIRVTMLEPALLSLRQVFRNVKIFEPELYDRISTAGSLCVRLIRGSSTSVSTHAFGLSVDLNIDGKLDTLGDGKTQLGLVILADFFKKEGWYWGAGFGREDSMHFQVSKEKIEQWLRQGLIKAR